MTSSNNFYAIRNFTRREQSLFASPLYPAELIFRFMRALGRRQCYKVTFEPPDKIQHYWFTALDAPRTVDELRATLAHHCAGIHFGAIVRDTLRLDDHTLRADFERELVFDLDLRDNPERSVLCACGDTEACRMCWLLVECAVAILTYWLGQVCGFGRPLVVFSGGKGAHLWFGNARARHLTNEQRKKLTTLVNVRPDASVPFWRSYIDEHLLPLWLERGMRHRRLWADAHGPFAVYVQRHCSPVALAAAAAASDTSDARWTALCAAENPAIVRELVWRIAWPVTDKAVLKTTAKTVKAPFSLHNTTLRLALPLDADMQRECDPATMPRVPLDPLRDPPLLDRARHVLAEWLNDAGYFA